MHTVIMHSITCMAIIIIQQQEYINGEYATPIWGVNTALAKDDVRSRSRLVVQTKQRPAHCYYYL